MASKCLKFVFIVSALMAIVFYGNLEMATPKNAQNLIKPSLSHNDFNKESQFTEVSTVSRHGMYDFERGDPSEGDKFRSTTLGLVQPKTSKILHVDPHKLADWVFVKTHKTGSTTISIILQKVAKKKSKIRKFPTAFIGGYPGRIREEFVFLKQMNESLSDGIQLHHHFRFNYTVMTHITPKNTRFFSIIRKPWNNFQSSFYFYYHPNKPFNLKEHPCYNYPYYHVAEGRRVDFQEYLQLVFNSLDRTVPWFFRSKNYQAHDLGLDPLLDDDVEIEKAIKTLDSQIDLMMITEYMDESMILLKKLLDLNWSDILYKSVNINDYTPVYFDQNSNTMEHFNDFYKLDIALYEYFNRTFWKKVDSYGRQRMMDDIQQLKLLRSEKNKNSTSTVKTFVPEATGDENLNYTEIFEQSQKNYDHKTMTQILKRRVAHEASEIMDETLLDSLIDYMVQNNGGCPIDVL